MPQETSLTTPLFCDPFTLRIYDCEPGAKDILIFRDQETITFNGTIWHRVTPGLLAWMRQRIEQARKQATRQQIDSAVQFYEELMNLSGQKPEGTPVPPVRRTPLDIEAIHRACNSMPNGGVAAIISSPYAGNRQEKKKEKP